jgi:heme oxygenase
MTFKEISDRFSNDLSGSDAFKALYRGAFDLMKVDVGNAGLYFVIGVAAQAFVQKYEDQGITAEFADNAKATMVALTAKIVAALDVEPAQRLRMLGEVATEYEWNVTVF